MRGVSKGVGATEANRRVVSKTAVRVDRNVVATATLCARFCFRRCRHAGVVAGRKIEVVTEKIRCAIGHGNLHVADRVVLVTDCDHGRTRHQGGVGVDGIVEDDIEGVVGRTIHSIVSDVDRVVDRAAGSYGGRSRKAVVHRCDD